MANYKSLQTTINANVKRNGNQEITGQILNSVLNAMVDTLGTGYSFAGVATPATNPGTPDAKVFYIANGKGSYTHFGELEVTEDDVVVLYWDSSWHKVSTGIASNEKLSKLESRIISLENAGYQFVGVATVDTSPGTPEQKVFYMASMPGVYRNFNNLEIVKNEIACLVYNNGWTKQSVQIINSIKSIGLDDIVLSLSRGFYRIDFSSTETDDWNKALINDISNYRYLIIGASVRNDAYISLTDSNNKLLWQTNTNNTNKWVIDLDKYPGASKLYLSNETSNLANPYVVGIDGAMANLLDLYENKADIEALIDSFIQQAVFPVNGYIKTDGTVVENNYWRRTNLIPIEQFISARVYSHPSVASIAFYSANNLDSFISGLSYSEYDTWKLYNKSQITIPDGTKYVVLSSDFVVPGYWVKIIDISAFLTNVESKIAENLVQINNVKVQLSGVELINELESGFYDKTLEKGEHSAFNCEVLDISEFDRLVITASVRTNAYLSLTDSNKNILWQSNDSSVTTRTLDLSLYPNAAKLYFTNETSVINTPSVIGYKGLIVEVQKLSEKVNAISGTAIKIAHFSFDDVHYSLEDITTNANTYSSIFDNPFFAALKNLHDNLGMVFSLYVFWNATASDGVTTWHLTDVTNKFANDFTANAKWLKFGLHTGAYSDFVTQILRITGTPECIDTVPRFNGFVGSLETCLAARDAKCGIIGLLCPDDNRNGYYFDSTTSAMIYNRGKYFDAANQLYCFRSLKRIESQSPDITMAEMLSKDGFNFSNNAIWFSHEYELYNSSLQIVQSILQRIRMCGVISNANGYKWEFPMNKIRMIF